MGAPANHRRTAFSQRSLRKPATKSMQCVVHNFPHHRATVSGAHNAKRMQGNGLPFRLEALG